LTLSTASNLRNFILTNTFNTKIVLHYESVFESASVDTCLLFFRKTGDKNISFCSWSRNGIELMSSKNPAVFLTSSGHVFGNIDRESETHSEILNKINRLSIKFGNVCDVRNGVQAYTVGEGNPTQTKEMKLARIYHAKIKEDDSWLKYLDGVDVKRYSLSWSGQYIKYGSNLSRSRESNLFIGERLIVRQIPTLPPYCIIGTFIDEKAVVDNNCLIIKPNLSKYKIKYVLGVINSKLISYWFVHTFGKLQRKTFPQFKVNELREFPIIDIDLDSQNRVIESVDKILAIIESHDYAENPAKKAEVKEYETQIDQVIYKLYDLTPEEIKIIEDSAK
jgi:hypothetical protein